MHFSNEHLLNMMYPNHRLQATSVLEGPYEVPRCVLSGYWGVVRFNWSGDQCHVLKGAEDIECIKAADEMWAFLLLERYFHGLEKQSGH